MNVMLDFICMGFAVLWITGRERQIQNENISPARFEPVIQTLRAPPKTARYNEWDIELCFKILNNHIYAFCLSITLIGLKNAFSKRLPSPTLYCLFLIHHWNILARKQTYFKMTNCSSSLPCFMNIHEDVIKKWQCKLLTDGLTKDAWSESRLHVRQVNDHAIYQNKHLQQLLYSETVLLNRAACLEIETKSSK